ncbi:MAG TPA: carboxypeptidase-like regulatory domain-containing protein, partial [Blastocatellia bacterium]|nr:carboxypeptidase-like regulatory domain-containing protein [Blastocatellia bacterium]
MDLRVIFWILLCSYVAQAQTTSPSPNKGVITGRVIGEDGQPLAGVSIRLTSARSGSTSASPLLTNEEGFFRLTELAPAAYSLTAFLPAYVTTSVAGAAGESGPFHDGDSVSIRMAKGGVITGRVTSPKGEPIPGLSVKAVRLRDADGKPLGNVNYSRRTDDRGVYRIFGLAAGVYVVHTDGPNAGWSWMPDEQVEDAPTYHPSSSRDTATELTLQYGVELNGIDIRYRGDRGRRVSGKLFDASGGGGGYVYLQQASSGEILLADWRVLNMNRREEGVGFEIRGVADGEYDLVAERLRGDDDGAASPPRRIAVRGADVSGIELRLQPFASVTGKMSLVEIKSESKEGAAPGACAGGRQAVFDEATLTLL